MDTFFRNLLSLVIMASLVGGLYLGYLFVQSYDRSSTPTSFRSFTVSGDGTVSGTPDIAELSFSVITEGDLDIAAAQSQNAENMNTAIDFAVKQGLDKKDITTSGYSINARYESIICSYESGKVCPAPKVIGYTIHQSVSLKIRDFKNISPLLNGVVKSGANSVSGINFTIEDDTSLENTARAAAIAKAQAKAESIAQSAGFELGRILEITESSANPYYPRTMAMKSLANDASGAVSPTIEAGSQEVTVDVSVKYEIR